MLDGTPVVPTGDVGLYILDLEGNYKFIQPGGVHRGIYEKEDMSSWLGCHYSKVLRQQERDWMIILRV